MFRAQSRARASSMCAPRFTRLRSSLTVTIAISLLLRPQVRRPPGPAPAEVLDDLADLVGAAREQVELDVVQLVRGAHGDVDLDLAHLVRSAQRRAQPLGILDLVLARIPGEREDLARLRVDPLPAEVDDALGADAALAHRLDGLQETPDWRCARDEQRHLLRGQARHDALDLVLPGVRVGHKER